MKPTPDEVEQRMRPVVPTEEMRVRMERVTTTCIAAAQILVDACPGGRNLSLALTALEEAQMRGNRAITHDGGAEG